jgi:uncharacterized membrane protein
LHYFDIRVVAFVILLLTTLRFFVSKKAILKGKDSTVASPVNDGVILCVAIVAAGGGLLTGSIVSLKLYPVLMNAVMFFIFASSLYRGPSMIERIARLTDPDLPESGVIYTRKVTLIWCVFFVVNGSVAAVTVLLSDEIWMLYNGLISYCLMGILLLAEYIFRQVKINKTL